MTGYTVHTGSTVKFSGGWDRIFEGKKSGKKASGTKSAKAAVTKAVKKKSSVKSPTLKAAKATKKKVATKSVKKGKSA
jgi:hypothetical protein